VVWGSPHYFAPEQARGEKPTPESDVYSIGIVLFEMLTGRLPYAGNNQQELALAHIRDRVPMVSEFALAIPKNIVDIVYKVMSKEKSARYRMADQLGNILESYLNRSRFRDTEPRPIVSSQPVVPTSTNPPVTNSPLAPTGFTPSGQPSYMPMQPAQVMSPPPLPTGVAPLEATNRVDLAPNAPDLPDYVRRVPPRAPAPPPVPVQQVMPPPNSYDVPGYDSRQLQRSNSQTYYPPGYEQPADMPPALDLVTIALAVLAFFAVACLIPLYIAVFQARFGG
jgi:serine/threonine protein kinase